MVEAMLDLVKDETERIDPLPGAGVRERQLPRADPAAQGRCRGTQVRKVGLRATALDIVIL
jgi:hypothetical protein